jgi:hypothetical protein
MNLNLQKGLKTRSRRGLEVAKIWSGSRQLKSTAQIG